MLTQTMNEHSALKEILIMNPYQMNIRNSKTFMIIFWYFKIIKRKMFSCADNKNTLKKAEIQFNTRRHTFNLFLWMRLFVYGIPACRKVYQVGVYGVQYYR